MLDRHLTFSSPAAYSCDFQPGQSATRLFRGPSSKGIRSLRYLFEEYAFDTDRRELHRGTMRCRSHRRFLTCSNT
jgi:hypothetical protein